MKPFILLLNFFLFTSCINNTKTSLIERAKEIHKRVITLDTHNDINIKNYKNLEPPKEFLEELPITSQVSENVTESREIIKKIISGKDKRLLIITGPCSIHDEKSGIEYAEKLVSIKNQMDKNIYLVMRTYFEKRGLYVDPSTCR